VSITGAAGTVGALETADGTIPPVAFDSTGSLLDAGGEPLTDESTVAVWAAETATNTDQDGNGDAVSYPEDTAVPLAAVDGSVLGVGAPLVEDDTDFSFGNEEFLLNAWDDLAGGGTVLWDEGHGQFYTKDKFQSFEIYAEDNGYALEATESLVDDLEDAAGVVITSPSEAFDDEELSALSSFVADGGAVFLHHQSDFRDFDETGNVNAVASALDVSFRFNDDQVIDPDNNAGVEFVPVTDRFNDAYDYFADREGLELSPGDTFSGTITGVTDGDTVDVRLEDGREFTIRVLGIDTPESASAREFERRQEWVGIDDGDYLVEQSALATERAEELLAGEDVEVVFDENSAVRDDFGRVLAYVEYEDDGTVRTFNRQMVAEGRARVYGSGFSRHDEYRRLERAARADGRGLWAESAPENSAPVRNDAVTDLFFPTPSSVRTRWGPIADERVPVTAAESAEQALNDGDDGWRGGWLEGWFDSDVEYDGPAPLVGVDGLANVAMVGGPIIEESYEKAEDYPVDTSGYGNFAFLTNLIDALADRTGDVLIDGGHGQFGVDYAQSSEDAAYYLRYLEGVGIELVQANDLTSTDLSGYRAVVVSTPVESFTRAEARRLRRFARRGGAVILVGAATAPEDARENLNELAAGVGTDLRLNDDAVTDPESNVDDDPSVLATDRFDESFDLFSPFDPGGDEATEEFTGDLETNEVDTYSYGVGSDPKTVELHLSGPSDADFDLYVTLDGREAGPDDYDRSSWRYGSEESITLGRGQLEADGELGIAVDAYSGAGPYTLTVTERTR